MRGVSRGGSRYQPVPSSLMPIHVLFMRGEGGGLAEVDPGTSLFYVVSCPYSYEGCVCAEVKGLDSRLVLSELGVGYM